MLAKLLDDSWDSHYACFLGKMVIEACHYAFKSQDNKPNRVGRGPFGNHVDPIPEIGLKFVVG